MSNDCDLKMPISSVRSAFNPVGVVDPHGDREGPTDGTPRNSKSRPEALCTNARWGGGVVSRFLGTVGGYSPAVVDRVRRFALPWAATAAVLLGLWLLFVDTVEAAQVYVGVVVAAVAATGSELVRHQRIAGVSPRPRRLLRLWRPVASVPRDLWLLTRAAASIGGGAPRGRFRELPFDPGEGGSEDLARYALAEGAGSFSPNTIVIGVDVERRTLLAHQLAPDADPARSIDPLELG
jgi:multisubunit Na+/H+ antiporter MnhE subunit